MKKLYVYIASFVVRYIRLHVNYIVRWMYLLENILRNLSKFCYKAKLAFIVFNCIFPLFFFFFSF